jgi:hypothetical protein
VLSAVGVETIMAMEYWRVTENEHGVVITTSGHDKSQKWGLAVEEFGRCMKGRTRAVSVIADLCQMTGYETQARRAWQDAFRQHRALMRAVIIVGARSPVIRMGAAVVGAVAGVPVRFVKDWAEVSDLART